ncbi:hypothetical protein SLEP1_g57597 [Rubroshorea leprosula]|uniref:Uncharacterized protein n=1 Tax=Rubroshorea leprosula TaxID=152421 RepID=A0AAV5MLR1_9ROSI|nr:hypothetical protein SLEP1_g57597 [Rubroshorea leprosula]
MGRESGNLVAKALGRDYGNLIEYICSCWCGNQESFSSSSSSISCRDDFFTVLCAVSFSSEAIPNGIGFGG